jgi:uncharacterized protein YndB with AHSA1/START domain
MYTIEQTIEIAAPLATLRAAITSRDGFRAWFTDTQVDDQGRYTFSFGTRAVTLTLDRADEHGIAMTCVAEQNNPEWRGTQLTLALTPLAAGTTRIDLAHAGYVDKDECYERSVAGWAYFMASLADYATTGKGKPFMAQVAPSTAKPTAVAS